MAIIRATQTTAELGAVTDFNVLLPEHVTDDLLLMIVAKDDAAGGNLSTPSGWTKGGENAVGASGTNTVRSAWYYKVATSGAESDPTITSTDADEWVAVVFSIDGVHSTPIDASNTNGVTDSSGAPYQAATINTNNADALVFYTCGSDGGVSPSSLPGFTLAGVEDASTVALGVAFKVQRSAGATGTCDFICSGTADESVLFTIAIRDGSSGTKLPAYPNSDCATLVAALKGTNAVYSGDAADTSSPPLSPLFGTPLNPSTVYQVDASPLTFTDITTAATNATDADTVPFPATEATGDYLAIGSSISTFGAVQFDRAGCTNGAGGVVVWEYLNPSGVWKALSDVYDGTTNFTATVADRQVVAFTIPADWNQQSLNSVSRYWIRARITTVYTTNPNISQIFLNRYGMYYDALAASADAGVHPLMDALNTTPATRGNVIAGSKWIFSSVKDLDPAYLLGTYMFVLPRDGVDIGFRNDIGVPFGLIDSQSNDVAGKIWCIGARGDKDTIVDKRNIYVVQTNQIENTSSWEYGTPDLSQVKKVMIAANNRFGGCSIMFSQLINVGTLKVSGGGSSTPVTYERLLGVANAYPCPMIDAVSNVGYVPIQIGGDQAVYCDMQLFFLKFPLRATVANNASHFHADENLVGIFLGGVSGDTIKIRNATISGDSPWKFEVLSVATSACIWDFDGLIVIGANVVLRNVVIFSGMSFIGCPSLNFTGCNVDLATISQVPVSNDSLTTNGSTLVENSSIDVSLITAGNRWCSVASPSIFENNEFQGGGGHAIRITTPGTYSLIGNIFTGFGADGTTGAAIYNDSGGAVTLNVSGGGNTPTVRNGAGASTTVNNNRTLTLTGLKNPSEVRVFNAGTTTEISGTGNENVTSGTHAFSVPVGTDVDISILSLGYQNMRILAYSVDTDATLPISQQLDRQYLNP